MLLPLLVAFNAAGMHGLGRSAARGCNHVPPEYPRTRHQQRGAAYLRVLARSCALTSLRSPSFWPGCRLLVLTARPRLPAEGSSAAQAWGAGTIKRDQPLPACHPHPAHYAGSQPKGRGRGGTIPPSPRAQLLPTRAAHAAARGSLCRVSGAAGPRREGIPCSGCGRGVQQRSGAPARPAFTVGKAVAPPPAAAEAAPADTRKP